MQYRIEVRPLATDEILDAYDWYEEQNEGLGAAFLDDLDEFYERILKNPFLFSYYDEPVRDGKLKRFPYTVAYEIFEANYVIVVYSVFMEKRNPTQKRTK